jgi:hypothetical protein
VIENVDESRSSIVAFLAQIRRGERALSVYLGFERPERLGRLKS